MMLYCDTKIDADILLVIDGAVVSYCCQVIRQAHFVSSNDQRLMANYMAHYIWQEL